MPTPHPPLLLNAIHIKCYSVGHSLKDIPWVVRSPASNLFLLQNQIARPVTYSPTDLKTPENTWFYSPEALVGLLHRPAELRLTKRGGGSSGVTKIILYLFWLSPLHCLQRYSPQVKSHCQSGLPRHIQIKPIREDFLPVYLLHYFIHKFNSNN